MFFIKILLQGIFNIKLSDNEVFIIYMQCEYQISNIFLEQFTTYLFIKICYHRQKRRQSWRLSILKSACKPADIYHIDSCTKNLYLAWHLF